MSNATKHPVLALFAAAGLLFAAGTASAQGGAPQGEPQGGAEGAPAPAPQTEQIDVSDSDVEGFVEAYMAVQAVNQEYTQKLQAVEDPEEATELQQEAQGKMEEAVSESGLSIDQYQQIANQAGQDEELRAQIEAELADHVE